MRQRRCSRSAGRPQARLTAKRPKPAMYMSVAAPWEGLAVAITDETTKPAASIDTMKSSSVIQNRTRFAPGKSWATAVMIVTAETPTLKMSVYSSHHAIVDTRGERPIMRSPSSSFFSRSVTTCRARTSGRSREVARGRGRSREVAGSTAVSPYHHHHVADNRGEAPAHVDRKQICQDFDPRSGRVARREGRHW